LITLDKKAAYFNTQKIINEYLITIELSPNELQNFDKLLKNDIGSYQENKIESSGYVVHTLEASMWCLMTTT
jgi:ADP-ribosylglycohydrolase